VVGGFGLRYFLEGSALFFGFFEFLLVPFDVSVFFWVGSFLGVHWVQMIIIIDWG
jgi:UPF0716 family protein affecting phage T7 exclusion